MSSSGSNRAQKTGIGYQTEKKQEQNYDREEKAGIPKFLVAWINGFFGEDDQIKDSEWKAFNTHLQNGVLLCKLINELLKKEDKKPVSFSTKILSSFNALTNIENFNKGCISYGLPLESTFQSGDLHELRKAGFYNVLTTLHAVAVIANSKGVSPNYEGANVKTGGD